MSPSGKVLRSLMCNLKLMIADPVIHTIVNRHTFTDQRSLTNVFSRKLLEVKISRPPNGPFDINSPYLSTRTIRLYGAHWVEFFIPKSCLPNFLKGQAGRDGIGSFSIIKSGPKGKRKRDEEANADASPDVGQSEEAADRLSTTARQKVRV